MPRLRAWFSRLLGLFSKNRRDAEMAEEMQAHLDLLTERNIAAGMSPSEARNAALREFGGVEQIKEVAREQRVSRWADSSSWWSRTRHRTPIDWDYPNCRRQTATVRGVSTRL